MGMDISREVEDRLSAEARRLGVSVNDLLKQLINERSPGAAPARPAPELPVWHLGVVGPLHRRDIYSDVR